MDLGEKLKTKMSDRLERASHKHQIGRRVVELTQASEVHSAPSSRVFLERLSLEERRQAASFEIALEACRPQLFHLAEQLWPQTDSMIGA